MDLESDLLAMMRNTGLSLDVRLGVLYEASQDQHVQARPFSTRQYRDFLSALQETIPSKAKRFSTEVTYAIQALDLTIENHGGFWGHLQHPWYEIKYNNDFLPALEKDAKAAAKPVASQ